MPQRLSLPETRARLRHFGIEESLLPAFGFLDEARGVRYDTHRHSKHQLLLPLAGLLVVETAGNLHVCSPPTGMWIPAHTRHATTLGHHAAASVFFSRHQFRSSLPSARTMEIDPLLREMVMAQTRIASVPAAARDHLLRAMVAMVEDALSSPAAPSLPRPRSEPLRRSVDYLMANLDHDCLGPLATAAAMSERTLRRRFLDELQMSPETYMQRARMIKAMQLLLSGPTRSVIDIALEVGYTNHSAFTVAFRKFCGKTPSSFRARRA